MAEMAGSNCMNKKMPRMISKVQNNTLTYKSRRPVPSFWARHAILMVGSLHSRFIWAKIEVRVHDKIIEEKETNHADRVSDPV